jgi:type II secretory pathway pseudopilin PulG
MTRAGVRGMSLVGLLVAVAIMAVTALAGAELYPRYRASHRRETDRLALATLTQTLFNGVGCTAMLRPSASNPTYVAETHTTPATCDGPMTLLGVDGQPLFPGSTFGPWAIRSRCKPTGIEVEVAQLKDLARLGAASFVDADFRRDPVNGRTLSWRSIVPAGARVCDGIVAATYFNAPYAVLDALWTEGPAGTLANCASATQSAAAMHAGQVACGRYCRGKGYSFATLGECAATALGCTCYR